MVIWDYEKCSIDLSTKMMTMGVNANEAETTEQVTMSNVINMRDQSHRVTDQTRVIQLRFSDDDLKQLAEIKRDNERKLLAKFFFGLGFGFVSFYLLTAFLLSL